MTRRADFFVGWLANSRVSLLILAVPMAAALWFMHTWGMATPDQSLQPHLPVLTVYGGFFLLGWLLGRQRERVAQFTRLTAQRWILAGASLATIYFLGRFQSDLSHPYHTALHLAFVLSYALAMGSFAFLTIGVFRRFCAQPRPWIRYVADSSYWMYLIHLPVVVWLQVAVAEAPFHWSLKLLFICTLTIGVALLSYDCFVRSTWIGALLNGVRRNRVAPRLLSNLRQSWREQRTKRAMILESDN